MAYTVLSMVIYWVNSTVFEMPDSWIEGIMNCKKKTNPDAQWSETSFWNANIFLSAGVLLAAGGYSGIVHRYRNTRPLPTYLKQDDNS